MRGKSTLINRLLGEDRLLTGPEAGITRDSIANRLGMDRPQIRRDPRNPPDRHRRHAQKARMSRKSWKSFRSQDAKRAVDFAEVCGPVCSTPRRALNIRISRSPATSSKKAAR